MRILQIARQAQSRRQHQALMLAHQQLEGRQIAGAGGGDGWPACFRVHPVGIAAAMRVIY